MGQLDGKIAVVTGASSGSGLGISKRFVEEGASVVMLARSQARLEESAGELGSSAIPIATDVGDPDSVRAAFSEIERRFVAAPQNLEKIPRWILEIHRLPERAGRPLTVMAMHAIIQHRTIRECPASRPCAITLFTGAKIPEQCKSQSVFNPENHSLSPRNRVGTAKKHNT